MEIKYIKIGEIVHDHYGDYKTIQSGDISKEYEDKILKDTRVGLNDDANIIIDFGFTDNSPYFWVCYNNKKSADSNSFGRSHAVYTECSWESLYAFDTLVQFPFADAEKSQSIVSGKSSLPCKYITVQNNLECPQKNQNLLAAIILYCLKKKDTGFKNFLYIIVPDSVIDYQKYCLTAISTIFRSIPLGLRKQFRIATNASEDNEKEYHILFCRKSVFDKKENKGYCVHLENPQIPNYMLNPAVSDTFAKFIKLCVDYPQGSNINHFDYCYDVMERYKEKITDILKRDYEDYYEIIRLCRIGVTPEVIKQFDNKLSQNLSKGLRIKLEDHIYKTFSDLYVLKKNIDKTEINADPDTFDGLFELLGTYENLIHFLQERNDNLIQNYFFDKMYNLRYNFCKKKNNTGENNTKQKLNIAKAWKNEVEKYKDQLEKFFGNDAFISYIDSQDKQINYYEDKYKKECIEQWKDEVCKDFSVENIKKNCSTVSDKYPGELLQFCCDLMEYLSYKCDTDIYNYNGNIIPLMDAILSKNPEMTVSQKLYEPYENEFVHGLQEHISCEEIKKSFEFVLKYFNGKQKTYISRLTGTLEELFKQGLSGKGCCSALKNDKISEIIKTVEECCKEPSLAYYRTLASNMKIAGEQLICNNLQKEVDKLFYSNELSVTGLESLLKDIYKYLNGNRKSYDSLKYYILKKIVDYKSLYSRNTEIYPSLETQNNNLKGNLMSSCETYDHNANINKSGRTTSNGYRTNGSLNNLDAYKNNDEATEKQNRKKINKNNKFRKRNSQLKIAVFAVVGLMLMFSIFAVVYNNGVRIRNEKNAKNVSTELTATIDGSKYVTIKGDDYNQQIQIYKNIDNLKVIAESSSNDAPIFILCDDNIYENSDIEYRKVSFITEFKYNENQIPEGTEAYIESKYLVAWSDADEIIKSYLHSEKNIDAIMDFIKKQ